jgi:hypothetical protein
MYVADINVALDSTYFHKIEGKITEKNKLLIMGGAVLVWP